jgi:DNA-binding response OmpR family regulator
MMNSAGCRNEPAGRLISGNHFGPRQGEAIMAATKTILLVDDDPEIVGAMRLILEKQGYRVVTAGDGNMGLAVAEREAPDLVVVDMMMPKKSGFLVLEKLKGRKLEAPRVIMITANEGSRHRAYAEMLGVDDYLRKPFAMDRLVESVRRLCPLPNSGAPQP